MLNTVNFQGMNREMRVNALKRALVSQPYFSVLPFEVGTGTEKENQYNAKLEVNKDFYLTEIQTNLGEVFRQVSSLFDLSVYTGYQQSVYRYDAQQPIPSAFIAYEARFDTVLANLIFDDRQREMQPFLIKNGDKVLANVKNATPKTDTATAYVCLKGFQMLEESYIDSRTQQAFNASLEKPTMFQYFKATIDKDGFFNYLIENDGIPRIILGFGVRNSSPDKSKISRSEIRILDQARQLQFNNEPIPVEFFAPRLTCLLDTHIYYLPIEYYWQPYSRLQLDVTNTSPDTDDKQGYEFVVLTRTV